jgi:hypothetical protein
MLTWHHQTKHKTHSNNFNTKERLEIGPNNGKQREKKFQLSGEVERVSKSVEEITNGSVQIIDGPLFIVLFGCSIYNSVSIKLLVKLFPQPNFGNGLCFI